MNVYHVVASFISNKYMEYVKYSGEDNHCTLVSMYNAMVFCINNKYIEYIKYGSEPYIRYSDEHVLYSSEYVPCSTLLLQ